MNKFKYKIPLSIKEMQIKTSWRSFIIPGMKTNSGEEAGKGAAGGGVNGGRHYGRHVEVPQKRKN